jgi:hypothetical protein
MTKGWVAVGAFVMALVVGRQIVKRNDESGGTSTTTMTPPPAEANQGLLYGRVTTEDGTVYEGRLRWGGDEEALWGNYFNGFKDGNPWSEHVPSDRLPAERTSLKLLGLEIFGWDRSLDLGRPFMARYGDIARIDPTRREIRVTLKSGAVIVLDRFSADDLADGVTVWDDRRGTAHIGERKIRSIELVPGAWTGEGPVPLHGTVRTRQGDFTGFIQWNRREAVGTDRLDGHAADGEVSLPFETIRSIARRSPTSALVTQLDGREIVLSDTPEVGSGGGGIYVDDPRYGRVLVSWDAFERVDLSPGGSGPGYLDFPPGRPLSGTVVTRSGDHLSGRLVYDLDESETTETLDAPAQGVDYTILFGLISSIVPGGRGDDARATVTLHSGEKLELERAGDLGDANGGMLVFVDESRRAEYVPWADVQQIQLDRPTATYPR